MTTTYISTKHFVSKDWDLIDNFVSTKPTQIQCKKTGAISFPQHPRLIFSNNNFAWLSSRARQAPNQPNCIKRARGRLLTTPKLPKLLKTPEINSTHRSAASVIVIDRCTRFCKLMYRVRWWLGDPLGVKATLIWSSLRRRGVATHVAVTCRLGCFLFVFSRRWRSRN